jgi:cation diffusion facilitator family transporter
LSDNPNHHPNQPHDHHHEGDPDHDHDHDRDQGVGGRLASLFHLHGHSHDYRDKISDQAFLTHEAGIRTVWLAFAALMITAALQIIIVTWSGSVALLADTIHNVSDGLNSIPLLIAFYLARRAATRRYTYGFGRAEDVAGIFIVLSIAFSAGVIFWQSIQKLVHPQPITALGWVAAAAIIGFLGNEAVALLQINVGRRIGSAALVADGLHARTDGLTSLAVLVAAGGSWLGFPIVDPLIGILIGVAILFITKDAAVAMWYRLMDAIEPEIMSQAEGVLARQTNIKEVRRVRLRWVGHRLHAEVYIAVDPHLTTVEAHQIAEQLRHDLFHEFGSLSEVVVHVDPWVGSQDDGHELTRDHEPVPRPLR